MNKYKFLSAILLLTVSVYLLSARPAQAGAAVGFVLAAIVTALEVAVSIILPFQMICSVCGVVIIEGVIGNAIYDAAIACAAGLICFEGDSSSRLVIAQPGAGCQYGIQTTFYNNQPIKGEENYEVVIRRYPSDTLGSITWGFKHAYDYGLFGPGLWTWNKNQTAYMFPTPSGSYNRFAYYPKQPAAWGANPEVRIPYRNVCDEQGICSFQDQTAPPDKYIIYVAKIAAPYKSLAEPIEIKTRTYDELINYFQIGANGWKQGRRLEQLTESQFQEDKVYCSITKRDSEEWPIEITCPPAIQSKIIDLAKSDFGTQSTISDQYFKYFSFKNAAQTQYKYELKNDYYGCKVSLPNGKGYPVRLTCPVPQAIPDGTTEKYLSNKADAPATFSYVKNDKLKVGTMILGPYKTGSLAECQPPPFPEVTPPPPANVTPGATPPAGTGVPPAQPPGGKIKEVIP